MRTIKGLAFSLLFMQLLAPLHSLASTVMFTNLSQPGNQYAPDGIGIGSNPFVPGLWNIAATRLIPQLSGVLDAIEVPLANVSGPTNFLAFLMTQTAGQPGTVLESYTLNNVATGNPTPLAAITSLLHPTLTAGTPYWFAVTTGPASFGYWDFTTFQGDASGSPDFATENYLNGLSSAWSIGTGGPTGREGALVVLGSTVPEPHSELLVGIGLLALSLGWRVRKSA